MKERIRYIDIARAFAIIIIVYGHTCVHSTHCNLIFRVLYSFNIPLFFIISGYTFKINDKNNFKFVLKKFKKIMIPYFFWALVFLEIYKIIGSGVASSLNIESEPTILKILIGNGSNNALKQNTSLWFLPALFSMEVINYILIHFIEKFDKPKLLIVFYVFTTFFGWLMYQFFSTNLVWGLNNFLYINSFFILGYIFNKFDFFRKHDNIGITISVFLVGLLAGACNETVAWTDFDYNNYLLMLIAGTCISISVISLASKIKGNTILEYIGKNTMGILIFHKLIIIVFQTKLGIISSMMLNSSICVEILICILVTIISLLFSLIITYIIKNIFPVLLGGKKEIKHG